MTNEQAYVILENCASLLDSGTRFFTEDHVKQFHEAYELAMMALRKTERKTGKWIVTSEFEDCRYAKCNQCKVTQIFYYGKPLTNFCPNCGAELRGEQDE